MRPYQQDQEIKAEAERLAKVLFGDARSVDCDIIASHMATVVEASRREIDEKHRMQLAAISTAAHGYWKEGDSIHSDYDSVALRDVAKLYVSHAQIQSGPVDEKFEYSIQNPAYFQDDEPSPTHKGAPQRGKRYGPYYVAWMGAGVWIGLPDELTPTLVGKKVWITEAGHNYGKKLQRNGTLK